MSLAASLISFGLISLAASLISLAASLISFGLISLAACLISTSLLAPARQSLDWRSLPRTLADRLACDCRLT